MQRQKKYERPIDRRSSLNAEIYSAMTIRMLKDHSLNLKPPKRIDFSLWISDLEKKLKRIHIDYLDS